MGFPAGSIVKNPPASEKMQEIRVRSLIQEDPLEKEMATQPGILAWEIPWTEELGELQFMGSQRIRHNYTHAHTHILVSPQNLCAVPRARKEMMLMLS